MSPSTFIEIGESLIIIDERYLPVLVSTFIGPSSSETMTRYFEWIGAFHERLEGRGERYVGISDARETGRPDALSRKVIAELFEKEKERQLRVSLGGPTVINSAFIRGAITAIQWLMAEPMEIETVGTMQQAFEDAFATLREAGLTPPADLDPAAYIRPQKDQSRAG